MLSKLFKFVRLFKPKRNYKTSRDLKRSYADGQPIGRGIAYKKKAASQAIVRARIEHLPKVRVKRIADGDTVCVAYGWGKITIRLDSLDCPEDGQYWGDKAKYGLIKLIGGRHVHLEEHGIDSYGRTLATIYVWDEDKSKWLNVNERMVMLGHAWVMRHFYDHLPEDRQENLNRLEGWARAKKVGLWHDPNPIPPWEWRNGPSTGYNIENNR